MKGFGLGLLVLLGILAITWVAQGNEFFLYKVFAPRMENVRRDVFTHTQSYVQGMNQDVVNFQLTFIQADPGVRAVLATTLLHRLAGFPDSELDYSNRSFVDQLRREYR